MKERIEVGVKSLLTKYLGSKNTSTKGYARTLLKLKYLTSL